MFFVKLGIDARWSMQLVRSVITLYNYMVMMLIHNSWPYQTPMRCVVPTVATWWDIDTQPRLFTYMYLKEMLTIFNLSHKYIEILLLLNSDIRIALPAPHVWHYMNDLVLNHCLISPHDALLLLPETEKRV